MNGGCSAGSVYCLLGCISVTLCSVGFKGKSPGRYGYRGHESRFLTAQPRTTTAAEKDSKMRQRVEIYSTMVTMVFSLRDGPADGLKPPSPCKTTGYHSGGETQIPVGFFFCLASKKQKQKRCNKGSKNETRIGLKKQNTPCVIYVHLQTWTLGFLGLLKHPDPPKPGGSPV